MAPFCHRPLHRVLRQPLPRPRRTTTALGTGLLACGLLLGGCQLLPGSGGAPPSAQERQLLQRQEQLELKLQQLEQKLNNLNGPNGADSAGKPPAGPVKSLTLRTGTEDDRLRIYWADGSSSDLPCTKEQATLVCG
jgi:hypothetical protein